MSRSMCWRSDSVAKWLCQLAMLTLAFPAAVAADQQDLDLVDQLVNRGLDSLADVFLQHQIDQDRLPPAAEVDLVNSRLQLLTQQAMATPWERRAEVWQEEDHFSGSWLAAHPQHSHRLLVELQRGLDRVTLGRLERLESDLTSNESIREHARQGRA